MLDPIEEAILRYDEMMYIEGVRQAELRLFLIFATTRFGEPDARTRETVEVLDVADIEALTEGVFDAQSWRDVLRILPCPHCGRSDRHVTAQSPSVATG